MSVAPVVSLPHPLVGAVEQIKDALNQMPTSSWQGLEPATIAQLSGELLRIEARIRAQQAAAARVLDASGFAKSQGASSTGAMLAGSFGGDRRAGDQMVHLGHALESASRAEDALAKGEIGAAQAAIIAGAVADLPEDTTPEQKQACEDTLIGDAGRYNLKDLRSRSRRIADQFKPAPEVDQIENTSLEAQERDAWRRAEFWIVDNRDGTHRGGFTIPDAQADMLRTAIEAISAPRRDHLHDHTPGAESYYDRDLDHRHRLGMGLAELAGHLPGDQLPGKGGLGATLMVRFDYDTLIAGIKPATLSTGTRISAGQARQMACRLAMIPRCSTARHCPWTTGTSSDCSPRPNAKPWPTETAAAPSPTATDHRNGPKPTTGTPDGPTAARRGWKTASCSAPSTTAPSTTTNGSSACHRSTATPNTSHPAPTPGDATTDGDPKPDASRHLSVFAP